MKSFYELTPVDDILIESIGKDSEFIEFSNVMSELTRFTESSFYVEGVKDTTPNLRSIPKNIKKNTWDTTKDIAHAYGNITDANSDLIKSSWDIVMRAVNLVSRALSYVIEKITNIPKLVLKTADRAMDIPGEVKAKIKGNITLNITAADIEVIYNKLLMQRIREYITLASALSKGEFWSTMTHKRASEDSKKGNIIIGENDMKTCRNMDKVYTHLQNTEFKPTIIEMKDQATINTYFGDSRSIKFTDNYGKSHECNYYEALSIMIKDLEDMKTELKDVQVAVGQKLKLTEANQNYNKLDGHGKHRLGVTISQISKVIAIIGNFIKYITADLNVINTNIDKILGNANVTKVSGKTAAKTPAAKINTNI